jgi:Tfp pilus assembly protein PilZ
MNSPHYPDGMCDHFEKRKEPRMRCSAPIEYTIGDQTYKNLSRDISPTGLFIETWGSFAIGEGLSLTLPLSSPPQHIKVNGRIVRTTQQGIGIQFVSI